MCSVLIPARNQRERLLGTLDSIARTRIDLSRVEVVVVDDGSEDGTCEAVREKSYAFDLSVHRIDRGSQSAATNEALRHARGEIVLSSAQDILFDPDLFAQHLACHERFRDEELVVLGYLPYPPGMEVTPFMFYLVHGGYQFAYYLIRDPYNVPPNFLYAPNFSARRDLLLEVGGFDERFPYGCQDTDLGIRLAQRGARIVYNPDAVGYHNHPMTLEAYLGRQELIGAAVLHLQDKHPDHEGGKHVHDLVLQQYLMCSDARLDRAHARIARAERELRDGGVDWESLWDRAFCQCRPVHGWSEREQATLRAVERLFQSYHTILGFFWARGYLNESLATHGAERVQRWLDARLAKMQASIPVRRTVERRLAAHGFQRRLCSARDYRFSLVVHDVADYRQALRLLESFEDPPAGRCNVQVVMVLDTGNFSAEELEHLSDLAELVPCSEANGDVLGALAHCEAELVAVISAGVEPLYPEAQHVAEKLLTRVPGLAVVGGAIAEGSTSRRRYGYRLDGASLTGSEMDVAGTTPIDVVIPECCWFRKSVVSQLLEQEAQEEPSPWNFRICRLAARASRPVIHVPQLAVRAR